MTVRDKDCDPQPYAVAVTTTVPDQPSVQVTRPVSEFIVPADSLFQDQVTCVLDVN